MNDINLNETIVEEEEVLPSSRNVNYLAMRSKYVFPDALQLQLSDLLVKVELKLKTNDIQDEQVEFG